MQLIFKISIASNVVVTGLSTLVHDLNVGISIPVKVTFALNAPDTVTLKGVHDTALSVLAGNYNLTGQGDFEVKLVNFATKIAANVLIILPNRVSISRFDIELSYDDFGIDFGATQLNGVPLDWANITTEINSCFDLYWPIVDETLTSLVMEDLNELLKVRL